MHSKDICKSGDKYGSLTVIDRNYEQEDLKVKHNQQRRPWYNCKCDCGEVCVINGYNLVRGTTKSCGCAKRKNVFKKMTGKNDLTNKIFGNLVVLHRDEQAKFGDNIHARWVCQCKLCGSLTSIRGSELRLGNKVDCGCGLQRRVSDSRTEDLTGRVFGYLKVVERDRSVGYRCGQHAKWICECSLCGNKESVESTSLRLWKIMCGRCCKNSTGERVISDILSNNGIKFLHDKPYLDCKNDQTGFKLRFDFIVQHNPTYLIEYDGSHHFKPAGKWDNNGDLDERQRKDAIKNEWCRKNNIPPIRIPYTVLASLTVDDLRLETSKYLINNN